MGKRKVHSLEEYLQRIEFVRKRGENYPTDSGKRVTFSLSNMFFRGHADTKWDLTPSLFRNENLMWHESDILKSAEKICWSSVSNDKTALEKMIRFQHYGLVTRLLDLTSNPLVALYFAVCDCENKDGEIFIFSCTDLSRDDWKIANIMAESIWRGNKFGLPSMDNYSWLKEFVCDDHEWNQIKGELYKTQFFYAPYNNNRIAAQRGAFILPPLCDKTQGDENNEPCNNLYQKIIYTKNKNDIGYCPYLKDSIIIDKADKVSLRKELRKLGIDEATIFPDLEHSLREINKMFNDK